jgi:adenylosuccinate lyase
VQRHAHAAWNQEGGNFRANLESDAEVGDRLSPQQIESCFSCELHQAQLDVIWQRLGI